MWTVRITDAQRDALLALLRDQDELGAVLGGALEELDYARWDDLPDAELPWDRVAELAAAQGIGEADVVWDLCGGLGSPLRSSAKLLAAARARGGGRSAPQRSRG